MLLQDISYVNRTLSMQSLSWNLASMLRSLQAHCCCKHASYNSCKVAKPKAIGQRPKACSLLSVSFGEAIGLLSALKQHVGILGGANAPVHDSD
jgi:hypothetical protein